MTALVALIVATALVTVAWIFRPQREIPAQPSTPVPSILDERLFLKQVIVTLKSGSSFSGVLYAEDAGAVVLCKAEHLQSDGTRVRADGEIVVLRDDIDFIQRP